MAAPSRLDSVVSLAKRRGFVFPVGGDLRRHPLRLGLRAARASSSRRTSSGSGGAPMVTSRDDIVGLDSSVILPRQVWVASGHVGVFTDPLTECQRCHKRFRADHLLEEFEAKKGRAPENGLADIACPNCGTRGAWTEPRDFNMMLKTYLGPVEDESGLHYLRPETAQGIFVNFANVMDDVAQEAAVRHRPDRQVVPQRDHARQLHLPHPRVRADGDGVLRRARAPTRSGTSTGSTPRTAWYTDLGISAGQPAALRAPEGEAVALLQAHRRHRVPLRLPGHASGASSRASPTAPTST